MFDIIAFDADDTLWHNEIIYSLTQDKLKRLLSKYRNTDTRPYWTNITSIPGVF